MRPLAVDLELQQFPVDVALIRIDRLSALAGLLAVEDVAVAFARLSVPEQVAIFGTFEDGLEEARSALMRSMHDDDHHAANKYS